MYSVTVAKYPHWVDLDCGEPKDIKGFTYLPRQDGPNGNVKEYKFQVSDDGKVWSEPVISGTFENNMSLKRVVLDKPVKARYWWSSVVISEPVEYLKFCKSPELSKETDWTCESWMK